MFCALTLDAFKMSSSRVFDTYYLVTVVYFIHQLNFFPFQSISMYTPCIFYTFTFFSTDSRSPINCSVTFTRSYGKYDMLGKVGLKHHHFNVSAILSIEEKNKKIK